MNISKNKVLVEPGYIYLPTNPTFLYAMVGSGVVITIFNKKLKLGGMSYFVRPIRDSDEHYATPNFSGPAIIGLLNLLNEMKSDNEDLEANIYGGAENPKSVGYVPSLGEQNIQSAIYILTQKNIQINVIDSGTDKGRIVIFNSGTGEILLAKVDEISPELWYPILEN